MDSRDKQIALLNINTAAAQLAAAAGGDTLSLTDSYDAFFEHLQSRVFGAIQGEAAPTPLAQVEAMGTYVPEQPPYNEPPRTNTGGVAIVGTSHGPIPAWLVEAAAKAGITKVYDNRVDRDGNRVEGTNRPHFKEAVKAGEGKGRNGDPMPFWPPKAGGR